MKERILLNSSYGIKNDVQDYTEAAEHTDGEMRTISPESILQTNVYREDVFLSQASEPPSQHNTSGLSDISVFLSSPERPSIQNTPVKSPYWPGKNKRKQYTPKRSPFNNITNLRLQPSVSEEEEEEEEEDEKDEDYEPEPAAKRFKSDSCGKFLRRSPGEVKNSVVGCLLLPGYMIVVLVVKQCMYKLVHVLSIPGSTKDYFGSCSGGAL